MALDASIFAHGAVIVPDFVTPAEEARILLRIGEASMAHRASPARPALRLPIQTTAAAAQAPVPRRAVPSVDHGDGRPTPAALRQARSRCSAS